MNLRLAEELLLLALDDEKGTIISSAGMAIDYGLAGAVLLELEENNRITLENDAVKVTDPSKTGDAVTDFVLEFLAKEKTKKIEEVTNHLGHESKSIREKLQENLIEKGILKKEKGKILWLIKFDKFPMQNDRPENEIRQRVRSIVLENREADHKSLMLINLMEACGLVDEVFKSKEEKKLAEKRIKELCTIDSSGQIVNKGVHNIQSAILMSIVTSIIIPTTIVTTASVSS